MTSRPPDYLQAMIRRLPPDGAPVVPGSTPVVAFGDPARAEVATLGINPSAREFVGGGALLRGTQRRLSTLDSLAAERLDELTDRQIVEVAAECAAYFQRNPYRQWFDPLDALLREAVGVSYYEGSACHLDLTQWATAPVWGKIADSGVRNALLDDGVPHLRAQLSQEDVRLILLNGRQVIDQVQSLGLASLDRVARLPRGNGTCQLYVGAGEGVRWVGWSTNLQSSWGVSNAFKRDLASWLGEACAPSEVDAGPQAASPSAGLDGEGHLPQGLRITGKSELVEMLQRWLVESAAQTLGDVGSFGGRAWLAIDVDGEEVVLNADTKRSAVISFVNENSSQPERPWRVVANRRGRFNKVVPGPGSEPRPGWYAYLTSPRSEPGEL